MGIYLGIYTIDLILDKILKYGKESLNIKDHSLLLGIQMSETFTKLDDNMW